jgi:CheY-like chemotaxis protein
MQLSNAHAGPAATPLHRPTVLVVEDDEDARAEVAELLRDAGYVVTEADDGLQGLELLRSTSIDIVLLDLWLPGMDGWSFRAEQRAEEALRDIPVVVMTADNSPQARAIDADAILRKPFGIEALSSTIRHVLADRSVQVKGATERVSEAVSLLAGAVGHEVADPLMALIGGLESARDGTHGPGGANANVERLLDQCWRIASSLRTLRDLPCPPWTREDDIDLDQVVRSAIARVSTDGIRVVFETDGAAWVRGDPLVVLYLCTALVHNAVEAVPRSNRPERREAIDLPDVLVRVHRSPSEVVLDVRDFGTAIPDQELHRIFALDNPGRERAWGAGLRLWFVRQIVEMLGGLIEISNVEEGGVLCRVRLPAKIPDPTGSSTPE